MKQIKKEEVITVGDFLRSPEVMSKEEYRDLRNGKTTRKVSLGLGRTVVTQRRKR